MTIISFAVAKKKFLFGMCDCTVDSDVGARNFSLVLESWHMCGHTYVRLHVSFGMDCIWFFLLYSLYQGSCRSLKSCKSVGI